MEFPPVRQLTDFPPERDFPRWTEIITRQQQERKELLGIPESVEVQIDTDKPILFVPLGDVHAGGEDINYEAFAKDVDLIREAGGYTATFGDLTDSYFFMPEVGEQIIAGDEQILYMRSALHFLAEGGHLLAGWGGDHDMWAKDKSGAHTLYQGFSEEFNAHYLEGVSYLYVHLNEGGDRVTYPIVGSHRHKGFSVYNDAHSGWRQYLDEATTTDTDLLSITAHKHTKAYLQQCRKKFGGKEIRIHSLALGTYKASDRYSRKRGWPRTAQETQSSFGIILHPFEKRVDVCWTLEEAAGKLQEA